MARVVNRGMGLARQFGAVYFTQVARCLPRCAASAPFMPVFIPYMMILSSIQVLREIEASVGPLW